MSKIIEALEKARKDGTLAGSVAAVSERDTVLPVCVQSVEGPRRASRTEPRVAPIRTGFVLPDPRAMERVDPRVEALHNPASPAVEHYRALRSRIERLESSTALRTIAVTSSLKGEGKSLTVTNLALVMAQDPSKKILLVDADLRNPTVHTLLGVEAGLGLAEYLAGGSGFDEVVRDTPFYGLSVVTAGSNRAHPTELLASGAFDQFIETSRRGYDYVLIDTPPLSPVSDVNFFVDKVDGALLVVREGKTPMTLLKQTVENLASNKIIGTVLNRSESVETQYGYRNRYSYGSY